MNEESKTQEELLRALSIRYREQEERVFPEVHLPQEYADLYAEWAELDGFVAGLAQRALAGKTLIPAEVEPVAHRVLSQRLERLRQDHPDVAPFLLEAFQPLEAMLDLLKSVARTRRT